MSLAAAPRSPAAIKVMLVDDSSVVRGLMQRWLAAETGVEIVTSALNGRDAVRAAKEHQPDVIVLDIEMPEMDGITAIPQILSICPRARILMASGLTRRNAEISIKALSLGAADYIPKPETGGLTNAADFKRDLIAKIRALGAPRLAATTVRPLPTPLNGVAKMPAAFQAHALVIGSSTGGPQALQTLITALEGRWAPPILIAQHMPPMFTTILADHLGKASRSPATEARDGQPVKNGEIYIAPGDFHMRVVRKDGGVFLALDKTPPVNFCRPAVDPLFESAAEIWGAHTLGLILTGMGSDGKKGSESVVAKGGVVIAQDEASSVVWGMPGAVARASLAAQIKPLNQIAPSLLALNQKRF